MEKGTNKNSINAAKMFGNLAINVGRVAKNMKSSADKLKKSVENEEDTLNIVIKTFEERADILASASSILLTMEKEAGMMPTLKKLS